MEAIRAEWMTLSERLLSTGRFEIKAPARTPATMVNSSIFSSAFSLCFLVVAAQHKGSQMRQHCPEFVRTCALRPSLSTYLFIQAKRLPLL